MEQGRRADLRVVAAVGLISLVAAVTFAGAAASGGGSPSEAVLSRGTGGALSERAVVPQATVSAVSDVPVITSTTTTVAARRPATTGRAGPVTTAAPDTTRPAGLPGVPYPTTTTRAPGAPPFTIPVYTNPPEWAFEENGVFARLRIVPGQPHVGQTVEFVIETWTTRPNTMCCDVEVRYAQDIVFSRKHSIFDPCPTQPAREDRFTYRVTFPSEGVPVRGMQMGVGVLLYVGPTTNPCAGPAGISGGQATFSAPLILLP